MEQEPRIYETAFKHKIIISVCSFFIILIAYFIVAILFKIRMPGIAAALGLSIAFYFIMFPKVYVCSDRVFFKQVFKRIDCPFNSGKFNLVEKKGIASLFVSFSLNTVGIEYTSDKSKLKQSFGWMLKENDVKEIFDLIQQRSKINASNSVTQ